MKKLLPILLLLLGAGGGVGAGYFLRPPPPEPETAAACEGESCPATPVTPAEGAPMPPAHEAAAAAEGAATPANAEGQATGTGPEYVSLQRQMIVPIVDKDQVISLVVMSLSVEVKAGFSNDVYDREPKLRDAFLQVLFRHANTGGFSGDFTSGEKMADLRRALNSAAAQVLGPVAIQVLVTDILRQAT